MARRKKTEDALPDFEGGVAVAELPDEIGHADELPPIPAAPKPPAVPSKEWRFRLQSSWTAPFVVVIGCDSEEDARAELHRYLDAAIKDVQRAGR